MPQTFRFLLQQTLTVHGMPGGVAVNAQLAWLCFRNLGTRVLERHGTRGNVRSLCRPQVVHDRVPNPSWRTNARGAPARTRMLQRRPKRLGAAGQGARAPAGSLGRACERRRHRSAGAPSAGGLPRSTSHAGCVSGVCSIVSWGSVVTVLKPSVGRDGQRRGGRARGVQ